jgi:hypothetical protein
MTARGAIRRVYVSLHKAVNRFIHPVNCFLIVLSDSFHNTMLHVLLQDQLPGIIDLRFHRRQLNQYICTVISILHHPAHFVQMPDRPLEAVHDRANLLRVVRMAVIVVMIAFMRVSMAILVRMDMAVFMSVDMAVFVCMLTALRVNMFFLAHNGSLLLLTACD